MVPEPFEVDVDGVSMSGIVSAVSNPRAVVVAWHGGASRPDYFDAPGLPGHSLLRIGAALGFTMIAPDRPGYGASRSTLGQVVAPSRQVDLAYGVLDEVLRGRDEGAGRFLVGHSQGCVLSMRMSADVRGSGLLGIEIAGTGVRHNERAREVRDLDEADVKRAGAILRELLWQPHALYPSREMVTSKAPEYDGTDASTWPTEFEELAGRTTVPVRITLGDHEYWWQSGTGALAHLASMFSASTRVETSEQIMSSHNLSLGIAASAYHLRVLAFVEECALATEVADENQRTMEEAHG